MDYKRETGVKVCQDKCFREVNFYRGTQIKSLFILNNFLFPIFFTFEIWSEKFSLLSMVTPRSLKLFTTLTWISLPFMCLQTAISFGSQQRVRVKLNGNSYFR